ncbi:immunity protein 26 of polymorphic toxin system [Chitinophaga dinghuensis]|uniref:Immunity protein 26 of polymorphic toxin system n=1 Tax=Chitinophaga dinghuensis TaxID=1539050 RepID=A0A327VRT4_9BACT|nr:Imm26 family immunity protein [Chitinophaga dinghuensis]RAJ77246.1 immunity protein 26 of polymorphic toxin system [Chitinophaga dinghuensis]
MKKKDHIGEVFRIPVEGKVHAYARVIRKLIFDVYAFFTEEEINIANLLERPVAFTIGLHVDVFKKSDWEVIGCVSLSEEETRRKIVFFRQGVLNLNDCWLVDLEGRETKVGPQDCIGVERLAVWDYEHVEERLRNLYMNKKDLMVEHMKVKFSTAT